MFMIYLSIFLIYLLKFSVGLYYNNNMATEIFPPNNTYAYLLHPVL